MSQRTLRYILSLFLFLYLSCPFLEAQNTRWDRVLDEYEQICDDCIHLRKRIENKESVSSSSVTKLLGRLSELRSTLQDASGAMTDAQRTRFEDIRDRYARVMGERIQTSRQSTGAQQPVLQEANTDQKAQKSRKQLKTEQEEIIRSQADTLFLMVQEDLTRPMEAILEAQRQTPPSRLDNVTPLAQATGVKEKTVYRLIGIFRRDCQKKFEYGLMLNIMRGRWGGFIMASSNLSLPKSADIVVKPNGAIPEGGYFAVSYRQKYSAFNLSVGAVRKLTDFLDVYAGIGYGQKLLQWENTKGQWANVQGYDRSRVTANAGLIATWKPISVLLGASLDKDGADWSLGVGVNF